MDKKLAGSLLITLIAIIVAVSLSYYTFTQSSQNSVPSLLPTPTPIPTPTPSPSERPAFISKPSVPEFTVELADHSYVVPETTSIDPYTGQEIIHPSYTVENKTIDITIKNQPFTPPDSLTDLYYNVRVKGNFEQDWTELYEISDNAPQNTLRIQSASEYTVISIPQDYPSGGLVAFQVEAVIATAHPFLNTNFGYWTCEASGWSGTQTLTIP